MEGNVQHETTDAKSGSLSIQIEPSSAENLWGERSIEHASVSGIAI